MTINYNCSTPQGTSPSSSKDAPGYLSPILAKDVSKYDLVPIASCRELTDLLTSKESNLNTPVVILAFDEAHSLTENQGSWSHFSVMRHVLRSLSDTRVFSLFLSTTGKISQFASREDSSARIIHGSLTLVHPFTELGFDTFATKVSLDGSWDLERVTDNSHIVELGRPL